MSTDNGFPPPASNPDEAFPIAADAPDTADAVLFPTVDRDYAGLLQDMVLETTDVESFLEASHT